MALSRILWFWREVFKKISMESWGIHTAKQYGVAGVSAESLSKRRFTHLTLMLSSYFVIGALLMVAGALVYVHGHGVVTRVFIPAWMTVLGLVFWAIMMIFPLKYFRQINEVLDRGIGGAQAEKMVSQLLLRELPDEYTLFHDIPCPVGNIDHVVVGPTGVFILETKSHRGSVTAEGEVLMVRSKPAKFIRQVGSQVAWLKKQLGASELFIHAAVVFTRANVRVQKPIKGVVVLRDQRVVQYIRERPVKLSMEDVESYVLRMIAVMGRGNK